MADLRSMFGKPKATPVEESKNAEPAKQDVPTQAEPAKPAEVRSNPFARKAAAAQPQAQAPASAPQAAGDSNPQHSETPSGSPGVPATSPSGGKLAGLFGKRSTADPVDRDGGIPGVDGRAKSVDVSEKADGVSGEATRPAESILPSDHIPVLEAVAPTRELPTEMDKMMRQFVDSIDRVYDVLDDPSLLSDMIKSIMIELKANPQYIKLIVRDDVRTWVRAMRQSMGLARIKKQETKTKRAAGPSSKNKGVDIDMMADLASLGLEPE